MVMAHPARLAAVMRPTPLRRGYVVPRASGVRRSVRMLTLMSPYVNEALARLESLQVIRGSGRGTTVLHTSVCRGGLRPARPVLAQATHQQRSVTKHGRLLDGTEIYRCGGNNLPFKGRLGGFRLGGSSLVAIRGHFGSRVSSVLLLCFFRCQVGRHAALCGRACPGGAA